MTPLPKVLCKGSRGFPLYEREDINYCEWLTQPELADIFEIKVPEMATLLTSWSLWKAPKATQIAMANNIAVEISMTDYQSSYRWNAAFILEVVYDKPFDGEIIELSERYFMPDPKRWNKIIFASGVLEELRLVDRNPKYVIISAGRKAGQKTVKVCFFDGYDAMMAKLARN